MNSIDSCTISGVINHLWMSALSEKVLKREIGLKFVSTMWEGYPYWYVWFAEKQGVYQLELNQVQRIEGFDWQADFKVKYYPSPEELCFQGLSLLEKNARNSYIFDSRFSFGQACCHGHHDDSDRHHDLDDPWNKHTDVLVTGVPLLDYRSSLPEDFFYAGNIQIAYHDRIGSGLKLKTQSAWQVVMMEDYVIYGLNHEAHDVLPKNCVDRDYPGFDITDFFYQRLVHIWKSVHQYNVEDKKIWKGKGFRLKTDGKVLVKEQTESIQLIIAQTELKHGQDPLNMPPDADVHGYNLIECGRGEKDDRRENS